MSLFARIIAFILALKDTKTGKLAVLVALGAVEERLRGGLTTHQMLATISASLATAFMRHAVIKLEEKLLGSSPVAPTASDVAKLLDIGFVKDKFQAHGIDTEALKKALKSLDEDLNEPKPETPSQTGSV